MNKIVLASSSPRRKEMLRRFNIEPIVVSSNVSEIINEGENPFQIVMSLSFKKVLSVTKDYPDSIVIGADTIVVYDSKILGKPKDTKMAYEMLSMLSGNAHDVITGVCLIKGDTKIIDYELTKVKFRELNKKRINAYISTGEPLDKAGAYGIQGKGAILVEKIDGCYSNVVGLPLSKIDKLLSKYFNFNIL